MKVGETPETEQARPAPPLRPPPKVAPGQEAPPPRPWLIEAELRALTGRQRKHLQRQALEEMGIEYRRRWDGVPIVLRSALMGKDVSEFAHARDDIEPDLGAI